jgi:hypothetical protein
MDKMDTWHYTARLFSLQDLLHPDELNNMGAIGWELVAIDRLKDAPKDAPTGQLRWLAVFKKLDIDRD